MSKRLDGEPIYIDVDSTLCFAACDLSDAQKALAMPWTVYCFGRNIRVYPHKQNIEVVGKLWDRGYTLIVWSRSGAPWAEAVSKALGIDQMVSLYAKKPMYYLDDLPANEWMGERIYREYQP